MPELKNKIFFLPHYIGSLKYFARLGDYLKDKYEIGFLFSPKVRREFLKEMTDYCQKNNLPFVSATGQNYKWRLIPFYNFIRSLTGYKNKINDFLKDRSIKKIIAFNDNELYSNYLFDRAKSLGIETMVLQWAVTYEKSAKDRKDKKKSLNPLVLLRFLIRKFLKVNYRNLEILAGGNAQKIGVINQMAANLLQRAGVPAAKISVVGYLDFDLADLTKKKYDTDPAAKIRLAQKYGLDLTKKNIIIYSTPFNTKDFKFISDQQQLDYYQKIITILQKHLQSSEYQILLKLHPAENAALYRPLLDLGVKIFKEDVVNEELIYLSDLYIAHHSTTNFIPIIMNKEAIFINFLNLEKINSTTGYFGVKKYITSTEEFTTLVNQFKEGRLAKQYRLNPEIITPDSIKKILAWIN
jgi:hypothetical protein